MNLFSHTSGSTYPKMRHLCHKTWSQCLFFNSKNRKFLVKKIRKKIFWNFFLVIKSTFLPQIQNPFGCGPFLGPTLMPLWSRPKIPECPFYQLVGWEVEALLKHCFLVLIVKWKPHLKVRLNFCHLVREIANLLHG